LGQSAVVHELRLLIYTDAAGEMCLSLFSFFLLASRNLGIRQICGSSFSACFREFFISGTALHKKVNLTTDDRRIRQLPKKCQNCQRSPGVNVRTLNLAGLAFHFGFFGNIRRFWQFA